MSVLKDSTNLGDVKIILGQDCYHLHKATEYRKDVNVKPWAVRTKLVWMLDGPLPQQDLATESFFAAEVEPLADPVKTRWSIESYAHNRSYPTYPRKIWRTHKTYLLLKSTSRKSA